MIRQEVVVQMDAGLDTRPIALLVQVASQFRAETSIESGNRHVNAKSIMGMMTLGLTEGDEVTIVTSGADEQEAMERVASFLRTGK